MREAAAAPLKVGKMPFTKLLLPNSLARLRPLDLREKDVEPGAEITITRRACPAKPVQHSSDAAGDSVGASRVGRSQEPRCQFF